VAIPCWGAICSKHLANWYNEREIQRSQEPALIGTIPKIPIHFRIFLIPIQQIQELTIIVKEQQRSLNEMKSSVLPVLQQQQQSLNEIKVSVLPGLQQQQQSLNEIKLADGKFPSGYSLYFPFNAD